MKELKEEFEKETGWKKVEIRITNPEGYTYIYSDNDWAHYSYYKAFTEWLTEKLIKARKKNAEWNKLFKEKNKELADCLFNSQEKNQER